MKRLTAPALVLLVACGAGDSGPEGTHNAMKRAFESKDWGTAYDQIDPEKSEHFVLFAVMAAGFSTLNNKPAETELDQITRKHGVTEGKDGLKGVKDRRGLYRAHELY